MLMVRPKAVGESRQAQSLSLVATAPSDTVKTGKKLAMKTTMPMEEAVLLCEKKMEMR